MDSDKKLNLKLNKKFTDPDADAEVTIARLFFFEVELKIKCHFWIHVYTFRSLMGKDKTFLTFFQIHMQCLLIDLIRISTEADKKMGKIIINTDS